jgi:hypothetical protein
MTDQTAPYPRPFTMLFLSGASGSGTTLLTKILSAPKCVLGIGGKHRTVPTSDTEAFHLTDRFNQVTTALWDREGDYLKHAVAAGEVRDIIGQFLSYPQYSGVTHLLAKRSAPFHEGDRFRPDFGDLLDAFPDLRIIVTIREPRASTYSTYRRDFVDNLRYAAVVCEERLTYLSAQIATLRRDRFRVISYEDFCERPHGYGRMLAEFCGLPEDEVMAAIDAEQPDPTKNQLWQTALTPEEQTFLTDFFSERRRRQWAFLTEIAAEAARAW